MTEQRLLHGDRIQIGRAESAQLVFLTHDRTPDTGSRTGGTGTDASGIIGGFRQMAALLEALRGLGGRRVLDEVLTLVMDAASGRLLSGTRRDPSGDLRWTFNYTALFTPVQLP